MKSNSRREGAYIMKLEMKLDLSLGITMISWGIVVVFVDFLVSGTDILPDFLGYVLLALGLSKFGFGMVSRGSWVLAGVSFLGYFLPFSGQHSLANSLHLADALLWWFAMKSMGAFCLAQGRSDIASSLMLAAKIFVGFLGMSFVFLMGGFLTMDWGIVLTLMLVLAFVLFWNLRALHRVKCEIILSAAC